MHKITIAALALLLVAPLVAAQDGMDFSESYQVRIAFGDIPSTDAEEPAFQWNFEHTIRVNTSEDLVLGKSRGHADFGVTCDCDFGMADEGDTLRINFIPGNSTDATVTFTHSAQGYIAYGTNLNNLREGALVLVYLPENQPIRAEQPDELPENFYYPGVDFQPGTPLVIHQYHTDNPSFWFTVEFQGNGVAATPDAGANLSWLWLIVGIAVGVGVWYVLVQQGYVQKRQRKQIAGEAVHKTVAKTENKETLEGRKRALMASLKELEVAKMNKELSLESYDALKADFKRQTVTVMRAIEEAS